MIDDHPDSTRATATALGVQVRPMPDETDLAALVGGCQLVVPSPSVPEQHPVWAAAEEAGVPIVSELDLAQAWTSVPMVAVTGTNGKTTVTVLVERMLVESGVEAVVAGNNELPLVAAIDEQPTEVYVVEASSFRLAPCRTFRPRVGTWLNLAPDHLDWHTDLASYAEAKARIWAQQSSDDVAVAPADSPEVLGHAEGIRSQLVTFGPGGDWRVEGHELVGPPGVVAPVGTLARCLPHDVANALAAAATAFPVGATTEGMARALAGFEGLPHRVTLVGESGGVRYYDDSKATTPDATVAAISGFSSAVLIAGGRNKGLDLAPLADLAPRLRGVVAIGEAGPLVAEVFADRVPVATAHSMDEAVRAAAHMARPSDVVVLSPAAASFDWYSSYAERGADFARAVRALIAGSDPQGRTS